MQSVLNSVKGTALNVAEYLTPVLKVKKKCRRLSGWLQVLGGDVKKLMDERNLIHIQTSSRNANYES